MNGKGELGNAEGEMAMRKEDTSTTFDEGDIAIGE